MKIYIYNNFYKNEFVTEEEREIPDGYEFYPPETNSAPPEKEEGECGCFDGTSWCINLNKYKFSKYKLKLELQELNIWSDVWNSLTDDQKENLYLSQELDLNDNNFKSIYDYFKTKIPLIDDILMRCTI